MIELSTKHERSSDVHVIHSREAAGPEIDALTESLRSLSSEVHVSEEEPRIYAGCEWLLPGAVILYIGKGFIDGFLKELGANAASKLKPALISVFRKAKNTGSRWVSHKEARDARESSDSKVELDSSGRIGRPRTPLEIVIDLPHGIRARFVLPSKLDEAQVGQALEELRLALSFAVGGDQLSPDLLGNSNDVPDDADRTGPHHLPAPGRTASYVYDARTQSWLDATQALLDEIRQKRAD